MKTDGIASAASALRYLERRQEVMANNLANANTDGFKAERVFAQLFNDALPIPGTTTDLRAGTIKETGASLDLAMDTPGFLVVDTPNGERLSRGGSFQLDAQGFLADVNGNRALGEKGAVQIGGGTVTIDPAGLVSVNGAAVDRLRMENVAPDARLQHEAGTLFLPDPSRTALALSGRHLKQGFLEQSNVNTLSGMVDMISIQRAYESTQRALTTLDGIRSTIANDLGKL